MSYALRIQHDKHHGSYVANLSATLDEAPEGVVRDGLVRAAYSTA
jgi:superoxide dismutase